MVTVVLGTVALAAIAFSFAFALLTLALSRRPQEWEHLSRTESRPVDDRGGVVETMSRVLGEVERLAALRDRGVLTDEEFVAQKAKVLPVKQGRDRNRVPQRTDR